MSKIFKFIISFTSLFLFSFFYSGNNVSANTIEPGIVSLNEENPTTTVSPLMTFEEMVQEVADTNHITIEQAEKELGGNSTKTFRAAQAKQYRTLSQQFSVNSKYKPTMRFYCETSESGWFRGIKKILRVEMIRGYKGLSKQFGGSVYVNLEDPNLIFYIVNGDFYNNGSTTYSAGVNLGVGKSASIGFKASKTTNHYQYRYVESRLRF